ncbi:hypothetical protein E4P41_21290 [Geodermatophilus sp. DF01-2]|uniref:hypothetical protein n=1 Tax=Geodermatophilus sp. DF01-2 TaxID=2559610 RepID=UPI0010738B21|nr:hypothetical protein [Geodermatophilus sp. DF01_2]TFV52936.1 hypothetical protein E4P41_21290 [Geodermatophilus sp. DF01_2]
MSTTPVQTHFARSIDDDRWAWARRRRVRRRAALAEIALVVLLMAATLAAATTDEGWTTWFLAVWTIGLLAFIPLHSVLNAGTRGLFDRSRRSLDEHQQALRQRSYNAMGWPGTALTFFAWSGAVALVGTTGHVPLALCLGFLLWLSAGLLHYWHLAWTAPEEPAAADPEF